MKVAEVAAVAAPAEAAARAAEVVLAEAAEVKVARQAAVVVAAAQAAVAGNFCDFYKKSKLTKSRSIKGRLFILR